MASSTGKHVSQIRNTSTSESDSNDESQDTEQRSTDPVQDRMALIRKELSEVPFGELQKLKEKVGTKVYNKAMLGRDEGSTTKDLQKKKFKRENKNRPREISSKVRVPRLREVVTVQKQVRRDPRFDDLSGEYKEELFDKGYSFVADIRKREKRKVEQAHKKATDESKHELGSLLQRMNDQEKSAKLKQDKKRRELELKRKMRELAKDGKTPFFLKKSDKRKLELAERYRELKTKGQLDKYMAKKRKKNAKKDKRHLPGRQTGQDDS
ncbi:ribosomal RNA processing protein 36 homolog isoform X2 [Ptychodera flava]|uniref:ribosomal RNA processing protein 36 homolog isoform X2 n=1 Tax=Ptychodera flava TaxID=63121 RepID=UPI00396A870F